MVFRIDIYAGRVLAGKKRNEEQIAKGILQLKFISLYYDCC